jgi:pyruvate/2-oxoglutarate dehydrogenase complex dihydrolipoamide dehydrogenase (E3) component
VGDVTDRINLTPVALMEGMALAKTVALNEPTKPDYWAVPSAVFSNPNIATVVSGSHECYMLADGLLGDCLFLQL